MITADPIDKLVSSSDYQSTAEHLSLSQGFGHSQHSQGKLHKLIYTAQINKSKTHNHLSFCEFHSYTCMCLYVFVL